MAKRKFQLSEAQSDRLLTAYLECADGETRMRFQAVRLYGQKYTVKAIQNITGCRRRTLLEWVHLYQHAGLDGLRDHRAGGNSAKLTPDQRQEVEARLHQFTPQQILGAATHSTNGQFWTVEDLQIALRRWYGVEYQSRNSYYNLLHACGFSYQRAEKAFKSQRPAETAAFQEMVEKNSLTRRKMHRKRSS